MDGYARLVECLHGYLVVFVPFMHVGEFFIYILYSHNLYFFACFSQTIVSTMATGTRGQGGGNPPPPPDPTMVQLLWLMMEDHEAAR
jgi:hypothetical protein